MTTVIRECAALALDGLEDGVAGRFVDHPLQTLRGDLGLKVRPVDQLDTSRSEGGPCDGISYLSDGLILYRRTGNRRENFTLAHELGHWLVDQNDAVYDLLAQLDDPAKMLETVCDHIARLLLLPEHRITDVLGSAAVQARHVMALHDATNASVPACAIALKDRLPGLGAVVVLDPADESVTYSSIKPDGTQGWPAVLPWPGQSIPSGHPLLNLQPGQKIKRRTFWQTPWGARADFYVDAMADSRRIIAVFSAEDLWCAEQFHPTIAREYDERPVLDVQCCGLTQSRRGWPCATCGKGYCSRCGNCRCQKQAEAEALCAGSCFMRYLPHLLVDGVCEECR